ncbi:MAG: isocitrate lyase/phosphoenolpyruvate mutase family protein [Pseudomonadota bacterium]
MTMTQTDKAEAFARLHEQAHPFVIANVFDGGTARLMAELGFKALATSSWIQANMINKQDGESTRTDAMAHSQNIVDACDLPVSADLGNGFGASPEDVITTINAAAGVGLVGCSIEDSTGDANKPVFELEHAVERIEAAVDAAAKLPFKFTLTARSENYMNEIADLDDTIKRLQAFESAGADVLMAPGLPDLDAVRTVCNSVTKPVNFMAGIPGKAYPVSELDKVGVTRISLATSLYEVALNAIYGAASEIKDKGTFGFING